MIDKPTIYDWLLSISIVAICVIALMICVKVVALEEAAAQLGDKIYSLEVAVTRAGMAKKGKTP